MAVGSVLLYQLWPNRLPGGFVGVDVFFVISGFVIGSHLLSELRDTGRIRLGRFWARRAKRLLPASLLVLLLVTVATLLVAPLSTRQGFLHEVVGSVFYVQNWVLADKSVDYLALGDAVSPVQHYWTLSAEEQFYVGLPLVLALAALATRVGSRARRRTTVGMLVAIGAASLAYSVLTTASDPGLAYFSTGNRAWEFLAGALLGSVTVHLRRVVRAVLGGLGVLLVVVAAFALSDDSAFPGSLAAVPVVGAVLIIAACDAGPMAWMSRWRPVTWLGDISYAVYLWHWPMVVLLPYATGEPLTTVHKVLIGSATVLVAWLSTSFIEHPIRTSSRLLGGRRRSRVVGAWCLAASVVVAGCAVVGSQASARELDRLEEAAQARLLSGDVRCLGAAALDPRSRAARTWETYWCRPHRAPSSTTPVAPAARGAPGPKADRPRSLPRSARPGSRRSPTIWPRRRRTTSSSRPPSGRGSQPFRRTVRAPKTRPSRASRTRGRLRSRAAPWSWPSMTIPWRGATSCSASNVSASMPPPVVLVPRARRPLASTRSAARSTSHPGALWST